MTQIKTDIPLEGDAYENFIESLKSEKTKLEYTRLLLYFGKYKGVKSLEELLVCNKSDVTKYLTYLKNTRGLSASSRAIACAALRHFYEMNEITLPWKIIQKFIGSDDTKKHTDKEYSYEEVAKVLSIADLKYKSLIYLMVSSGVRVGSLHTMVRGDLTPMPGHNIYKVVVYRGTKDEYYTFGSTEFSDAVNNYLNFRKQSGEIITEKSPLWIRDFDPNDKDQVKNPIAISHDAIKSKIRHLLIRSGVANYKPLGKENLAGRRRNASMASHAFRKTCFTNMSKSRMNPEVRDLLIGHKLGLRASYLRYSEQDLLNEYLRALDNLTVNSENRLLAQVDEFRKQEMDIQQLKKENQEFRSTLSKFTKMMDEGLAGGKPIIVTKGDDEEEYEVIKITDTRKDKKKQVDKLVKGTAKNIMKSKTVR